MEVVLLHQVHKVVQEEYAHRLRHFFPLVVWLLPHHGHSLNYNHVHALVSYLLESFE